MERLTPRPAALGPDVKRLLPQRARRQVGPWVFLDHFGPSERVVERAHGVRPHPHIGLSTVSYLFAGAVEHRDSTGGHAIVRPDEIHWMRAGSGIVHSERPPEDDVGKTVRSHGLQLWCAHPDGEEEQTPRFDSYRELPVLDREGVRVQLLAGDAWGAQSPVDVTSRLVYAIAHLDDEQSITLPDHEELCVYPLEGEIEVACERDTEDLLVVERGALVRCKRASRVIILGGDKIGARTIWWNFVHSDKARIARAAERWRAGEFPRVPSDEEEFIPVPDGPFWASP